jgi:predicted nucleotidyltransferase
MLDNKEPTMPQQQGFNYDAAAENLRKRFEKRRRQRLVLHEKADRDCMAIITMIIKEFNPLRIYQWGSLLHPEQFDENSDIDIAVEGVESAEAWVALTGKAMDMTSFSLDIVALENVNPLDRGSIVNKGKLVYERK